jgi:preprotein translocase subunit YajC
MSIAWQGGPRRDRRPATSCAWGSPGALSIKRFPGHDHHFASSRSGRAFGRRQLLRPDHSAGLIFVIFWFLLIRPQQKRMKDHQAQVAAVKKGDRVVTGGGLIGKVTKVTDSEVEVELAQGIRVTAVKSTLTQVIDPAAAKPAND